MVQIQFGGRLTEKEYVKRAKTSEAYDGPECAGIRHISAHSLDTEKVGHGFKNKKQRVPNRIARTICEIAEET